LKNNRNKDDTGLRSAYILKSQNWYSQKLSEELNQKETKQSFIEKELKELQKKIAVEHKNMTKAEKKADEARKKEAASLETKRELMTPKINKLWVIIVLAPILQSVTYGNWLDDWNSAK